MKLETQEETEEVESNELILKYMRDVKQIPKVDMPEIVKENDRWYIDNADNYDEIDPDWREKHTDEEGDPDLKLRICARCGQTLIDEYGDYKRRGASRRSKAITVCPTCLRNDKRFLKNKFEEEWSNKRFTLTRRGTVAKLVRKDPTRDAYHENEYQRERTEMEFEMKYVDSGIRVSGDYSIDDIYDIWEKEEDLF